MITAKYVQTIVTSQHLSDEEVERFMDLYTKLPFGVRQGCAEQLVVQPSLVLLLFRLLQNEESFSRQHINADAFLTNETDLVVNFSNV